MELKSQMHALMELKSKIHNANTAELTNESLNAIEMESSNGIVVEQVGTRTEVHDVANESSTAIAVELIQRKLVSHN